MAVYQHKNGRWYYEFQLDFRRYHGACKGASSKKEAEKIEARIKSDVSQGYYGFVESKGKHTFEKVVGIYLEYAKNNKRSWKNEQWVIKRLQAFFKNKQLKEIDPKMIESYRTKRINEGKKDGSPLKNATLNREREILSKMFNLAVDNGWIEQNPCAKIKPLKEDNIIERYLGKDEEVRLLNACVGTYEYMRPIIMLAVLTGCRKGEILNLKWVNINLQDRYITLTETKNNKKRSVPINSTLLNELGLLKKQAKSEYVFANPETGRPYYDIRRPFKELLEKADITGLRFQDLRHTNATRLVSCGTGLSDVKEMLGHADLKTTSRYAHPVPEQQRKAAEALDYYNELLNQTSSE